MVLNFSSAETDEELQPEDVTAEDWQEHFFSTYRSEIFDIRLEESKTRPAWLAELLAEEIDCCLYFGRNREYFGALMLRCLGKIEMFVDGEAFPETRAILDLVKKTNYHLDISVLDDNELYATWLCVPRLSTYIDVVEVDVRLFGNIIYPNVARSMRGDGGHSRYEWDFLVVLERFLTVGPVSQKRKLDKDADQDPPFGRRSYFDRGIKVNTIVLNFTSAEEGGEFPPHEISYEDWQWQCMGRPRNRDEITLEEYNTRPEWLAELLAEEIHCCLHFGRSRETFGKLTKERLGKITMFVDGNPFREIDVAGRLDDQKYRA
ncbi:uncharacterized protein BDV14DRAFT_200510 [Aspergillus stella-maris]|uniref:uncharacterized protein n=1 Tax=Aspergillus stella-maris TaxID=1810926 RepID=UPI003CCDAA13